MPVAVPPVVYQNSRAASVFYAVPHARAQLLLEGTGLSAVRLGDRGVINATWFDYAESSIGPYREFSLGVVASAEHRRFRLALNLISGSKGAIGSFILALPVDSEVARSGGIRHYGLPKTLVDFHLRWNRSHLLATIGDAGRRVFSMDVPLSLGIPARVRELVVFSSRMGQPLTTIISTQWPISIDLVGHPKLIVDDANHPLGSLLAELGLESAHPLAVVHGPLRHAVLPEPPSVSLANAAKGRGSDCSGTVDSDWAAESEVVTTTAPVSLPIAQGSPSPDCDPPHTPRSAQSDWSPVAAKPVAIAPVPAAPCPPREQPSDSDCDDSMPPATVRSRTE